MVSHSHPKPAPIPHQRLRRFLLGALIVFALGLPYAHATDWARVARLAPPDADIFIVIERAGEVRRGAAGPTLSEIFASALPLTSASQAWRLLADGVGRPSEEAFDALLGARVMFIGRSGPGPMQWALVSEVDARVARRLLTSLGAKPAMIKSGRPIAEIEEGRFRLSARLGGDSTTLVFAPAASVALFGDLLARLDAPHNKPHGASLANDADLAAATAALSADAHAFLFFRTQDQKAVEGLPDWIAWAVTVDGMRVTTELAASSMTLEVPKPVVSRRSWRAASKDAILAVLEPVEPDLLPLASLLHRFSLNLDDLLLPIHGRLGLFVTEPTPEKLAIAVVAQTPSVEKLARIGDLFVSGIASGIAPGSAGDLRMLDGMFPATRRRVDLPLVGDIGARLARASLATDHFPLVWSYPADSPGPSELQGAGWWIIANDGSLHDRLAHALTHAKVGPGPDEPGPEHGARADAPLSFLTVRPRALLEALRRAGMTPDDEPPIFQGLSLIESIEGESRLSDGLLLGRAVLTLLPPPAHDTRAGEHRDR